MAKKDYGRTKSGTPISDELLQRLAAEAEEGFDVEEILRRRGGRPAMGSTGRDRTTTMSDMTDRKLWTAEELERLSPGERNEIIRAGIVTDMSQVPTTFLERVRENVREHIAATESAATPER